MYATFGMNGIWFKERVWFDNDDDAWLGMGNSLLLILELKISQKNIFLYNPTWKTLSLKITKKFLF